MAPERASSQAHHLTHMQFSRSQGYFEWYTATLPIRSRKFCGAWGIANGTREEASQWFSLNLEKKEEGNQRSNVHDRCDASVSAPSHNLYYAISPTKPLLHKACYSMYSPILSQRDKAVSVIPPPPGITPDFDNPPSRAQVIIIVHIVFTSISTLFMGLRFYTARFITRHVRVDDCKPDYLKARRVRFTLVAALAFMQLACAEAMAAQRHDRHSTTAEQNTGLMAKRVTC
ncbi:hypothetical protein GQ44DRAFT_817960 [Phaeosphaeriaceae sp. PMI808]|nr:hypothetical protein GQ44DRAFT_817960 [Phaeosphaeriaceae sp. PMI808]